ncbi:unnamed protein product [Linum tenue]|uniref:Uncharacterized protein n=1 Tax=Linum tenue TaxID=586396 RepID=A0AAV0HY47_9ROSI|nr:unnamed protein product [Linum tenue]
MSMWSMSPSQSAELWRRKKPFFDTTTTRRRLRLPINHRLLNQNHHQVFLFKQRSSSASNPQSLGQSSSFNKKSRSYKTCYHQAENP